MYSKFSSRTEKGIMFKKIPTKSILPNPEGNPRQNIKQRDIDKLCESIIACDGILVPLVVFPGPEENTYYLLDGERRLIAAKKLGLERVPVNILPKALAKDENFATMFTIHMARVPWNIMARAMALNRFLALRPDLEKNRKQLRQITSMSSYEINNAMLIRMFSRDVQLRAVYSEKPGGLHPSYLTELAKVIQKAEDLELSKEWTRSYVIDSFLSKIGRVIRDPYELKDLGNILGKIPKKEAEEIFRRLVKEDNYGVFPVILAYVGRVSGLRSLHVSKTKDSISDAISLTKTQWDVLLLSLAALKDLKLSNEVLKDIRKLLEQTQLAVSMLA